MPSREEIVEWLRDAAKVIEELHDEYLHDDCVVEIALFEQRAAQVAAMRCETCKNYDKGHKLCEVIGGSELLIPVYFGCFYHELKKPSG